MILKIKMQLLCILSKSHFQFGIKWKDYALQHLEESICIFGPIDYRLLKIDMNLKQLSVYTFFFFFFLYIVFFRGPRFIASANTVTVCNWDSRPPNRNHMARILLPDVSHVRTQEYTCYAGLILTQASFVLQSGAAQKMRVRFTARQRLHWTCPCLCYPSGNLPFVLRCESTYTNSCHAVNPDPHPPKLFHVAIPSDLGSVRTRCV